MKRNTKIKRMLSYLRFLVLVILVKFATSNVNGSYSSENLPLWTWECVNEKCVPKKTKSSDKAQSLSTCNMLCTSMNLWPQPTGPVSLSMSSVPVCSDLFQLQILSFPSLSVLEQLRGAFDLFREDLRELETAGLRSREWRIVTLRVTIPKTGSTDPRMLLTTDESYNLSLHPKDDSLSAEIVSNSFCGARHGLETLSQLIWYDPYVGSLLMMKVANVEDAPRFGYRGILLDTAHNYFPVSDLLRTIDGMAANKLNTFHWHATDKLTFPLLLNSTSQLAQYGAYSSEALYTTNDVRKVVQRAKLRGIRVLLEVDVGSVFDWMSPVELRKLTLYVDKQSRNVFCSDPPSEGLHSLNSHVFDILESIYKEILQLTGVRDIYYFGGDYVVRQCFSEYLNDSNLDNIWLEFTRNALKRLNSVYGSLPNLTLLWSSHLSERIKTDLKEFVSNIGLQVRNVSWAQKYLNGVRTVISHEDAWDLNSGLGGWYKMTNGAPYNSWQRMYEYRPWVRSSGCFEGGEATVWSSTLSACGLDSRVWPRAAAFAERLWSDQPETATRSVQARLDIHRSRLTARGIRASPLWSMWCTHNPYTCV